MSKAKDAHRYAVANEVRFTGLTVAQKLDELCRLRQARAKATVALGKAELALEAVDEFKAMAAAKGAVQAMEAAIEGTLMLIEYTAQVQMELAERPAPEWNGATMPLVNRETGEIVSEVRRP